MGFWEVFLLFFSFQAFFIAVVFFFRSKGDRVANRIFAILLLLFSYHIFLDVLYWSRFDQMLLVDLSLTLINTLSLYGPLFYLYIKRTVTSKRLELKNTLHFIPLLIVFSVRLKFYFLPQATKLQIILEGQMAEYVYFFPGENLILAAGMLLYAAMAYFQFLRNYRADIELKIWLKAVCLSFTVFALSCAVFFVCIAFSWSSQQQEYYLILLMAIFIGIVSYFVFAQPDIFNGRPVSKMIPFVKYGKTGLTEDFSLELKEKLHRIMETEKPYLDPDIRLDTIAKLMDVSRHHASQVINEHFSTHFFDFINQYRIREAERLLTVEKSKESIKNIAYSSGFNNRISFYKAFKKMVGTTPTEYRKDYLTS